jgi:putative transposase
VVDLYLLFFIHIGSRRVIASAPTANPDSAWVAQQARNASMQVQEQNLTLDYLIIDCDTKYTHSFDAVFEVEGAEIIRVGPRAPNLNAYAERWVRSLREECLDHFLICGERHLDHSSKSTSSTSTSSAPTRASATSRCLLRPAANCRSLSSPPAK